MTRDEEIQFVIDSHPAISTREQAEAHIAYCNAIATELERFPLSSCGQAGE